MNMTMSKWLAVAVVVLPLAGACARPADPVAEPSGPTTLDPPEGLGLRPVPVPDLALMGAAVQRQLRERRATLARRIAAGGAADELAAAYGEMGNVLMAARDLQAVEPYYLNAHALAPADRRWPYYLGHVYRTVGPLAEAATYFERARALAPDDVATLVWLGEVYLAQGRAAEAAPLFSEALAHDPASAAAAFGAGRVALAGGDHRAAVEALETALARDPGASAVRYPLAMAYRGLGEIDSAQRHLEQQGDVEPRPVDPLMADLEGLLESAEVYGLRARAALAAGNWAAAADQFELGLALAPADPTLRHGFGTALLRLGDTRGAEAEFLRVIQTTPRYVEAHGSLGSLLAATGRPDEAVAHFTTALEHEPGFVQARVDLAGVLGRIGRPAEALDQYARALEMEPTHAAATLGYAMTLVRMERYLDARDRLVAATRAFPDRTSFAFALARLLAAAPDERVRDGRRALALAQRLLETERTFALGETLAMAQAEVGRHADAARTQQDVIVAADRAGVDDTVMRRMTENLRWYEAGQACRRPFAADEMF